MKCILTLSFLLAFAGTLKAEGCVTYQQQTVCVTVDSNEYLFHTAENKFYQPFFQDAYNKATADGSTTLTLQDFRQHYLPDLQRGFLTYLDESSSATDEAAETVRGAIIGLPADPDKWYPLYAKTYGYEHFLYQWTLAGIKSYGLEPPEDIVASGLAPVADFEALRRTGISEDQTRQFEEEMRKLRLRDQDLYTIRQYLFNQKISRDLVFETPHLIGELIEWNRKKFLAAILPAHKKFAESLLEKAEARDSAYTAMESPPTQAAQAGITDALRGFDEGASVDRPKRVTLVNIADATSPTAQIALKAEGQFTTEPVRIIMSLWEDGRIIWSENPQAGGEPYREANIGRETARKIVAEAAQITRNPDMPDTMLLIPDASHRTLYVQHGRHPIYLNSAHDGVDISGHKDLAASSEFQSFAEYWKQVKQHLLSAIPERGKPVPEIDLRTEIFDTGTGQKIFSRKPPVRPAVERNP